MPLTPLHAAIPWIPYVRWPTAFSFWALSFGAMVNDVEVVPLWLFTGDLYQSRGFMHSVLGVLTFNAVLVVALTLYVVPPAIRWLNDRWKEPRIFRFAGQDLRRHPRDLPTVYASAAFGGLTHVLVDIPTHSYNPLWWPWQIDPLNLVPFADELWWDVGAGIPVLLLFAGLMYAYWRR